MEVTASSSTGFTVIPMARSMSATHTLSVNNTSIHPMGSVRKRRGSRERQVDPAALIAKLSSAPPPTPPCSSIPSLLTLDTTAGNSQAVPSLELSNGFQVGETHLQHQTTTTAKAEHALDNSDIMAAFVVGSPRMLEELKSLKSKPVPFKHSPTPTPTASTTPSPSLKPVIATTTTTATQSVTPTGFCVLSSRSVRLGPPFVLTTSSSSTSSSGTTPTSVSSSRSGSPVHSDVTMMSSRSYTEPLPTLLPSLPDRLPTATNSSNSNLNGPQVPYAFLNPVQLDEIKLPPPSLVKSPNKFQGGSWQQSPKTTAIMMPPPQTSNQNHHMAMHTRILQTQVDAMSPQPICSYEEMKDVFEGRVEPVNTSATNVGDIHDDEDEEWTFYSSYNNHRPHTLGSNSGEASLAKSLYEVRTPPREVSGSAVSRNGSVRSSFDVHDNGKGATKKPKRSKEEKLLDMLSQVL